MKRSAKPTASEMPAASHLPAAAGLVGVGLGAANLVAGLAGNDYLGGLFVWRDVALVYGLAAVPLAALAAGGLARFPLAGLRMFVPLAGLVAAGLIGTWPASTLPADLLTPIRAGTAFAGVCGLVVLAEAGIAAWRGGRGQQAWSDVPSTNQSPKRAAGSPAGWPAVAIAAVVLFAVPWIYRTARIRDDLRRLDELVEQSRLGEALVLAAASHELDPWAEHHGRPLAAAGAELERAVSQIAARASEPLVAQNSPEPYVARARDLAILGQREAALAALQAAELHAAPGTADSSALWLLRGTIYESRGQWLQGIAAYERARTIAAGQQERATASGEEPKAADAQATLVRATSGIAFCQRKAGDYRAAAETYAELLTLAPTAETHFLLAQFYEDLQATALAQRHAGQAIELDPEQFAARGEVLLDKLRTRHFGCWSVGNAR